MRVIQCDSFPVVVTSMQHLTVLFSQIKLVDKIGIHHKHLLLGGTICCLTPSLYPMVCGRGVYYLPLSLVYTHSLNVKLSASGVGCTFNSKNFNHLVYADDTVLLAPSSKALQSLINICVSFANNHGLVYNEQKTKFMCLNPAVLKVLYGFQSICKQKCKQLVRCKWYNWVYLLAFGQWHL